MRLVLIVFTFILLGFLHSECANEIDNFPYNQSKTADPNFGDGQKSKSMKNDTNMQLSTENNTDSHIPTWRLYEEHLRNANSMNSNISYVDFLFNFANITVHYLPNVIVSGDSIKIQNTVYDRELMNRTFKVDYVENVFLRDGRIFQYISGEMHYFRTFQDTWRRKMRAMRAAGLNVISTYIEWSSHNPQDDDKYVWTGFQDAEKFIRMAIEEDLLVILRPYPYICAERSGGGFPYWLVAKYPNIRLRTMDPDYLKEVRKWFAELMPRFIPYLYENGGPIILVQVENEYGVYGCNKEYQHWVLYETQKYVRDKSVLFTNDMKNDLSLKCGKIDGVLATTDFSTDPGKTDGYWKTLRKYQPNGPCVNSEYYTGWETYWFDTEKSIKKTNEVVSTLNLQLQAGCSVNIYMFCGGTNYGFTSSMGGLNIDIPSYDYNSAIDESGDITTRYYAIRNVIEKYFPLPNIDIPKNEPKMVLSPVELRRKTTLFSPWARFLLGTGVQQSNKLLLFEDVKQDAGFLLYETQLNETIVNPSSLTITGLHDRAIVYLNNIHIGTLARKNPRSSVQINNGNGRVLQILVENLGRQSYGILSEKKGIIGDVLLNDKRIEQWNVTGFPFANMTKLTELINTIDNVQQDGNTLKRMQQTSTKKLSSEPIILEGKFDVDNGTVFDTFIDTRGWGKGFIVINGFNLGRYWPLAGPQMSMYVPKQILKKENNSIIVVELEQAPIDNRINFIDDQLYMHVISDEAENLQERKAMLF